MVYPHTEVTVHDSDGDLVKVGDTYTVVMDYDGFSESVYRVTVSEVHLDGLRGPYTIHGVDVECGLFPWDTMARIEKT